MPLFRKKPIVIKARQYTDKKNSVTAILGFTTVGLGAGATTYAEIGLDCLYIKTLEGEMKASIGDWIIRGVNGEFYPCKPDIFEKTYEEVK